MYGRFTEKAERAIALAQESAMQLGHNYVGTEHLLLGLVKEGSGIAARVLQGQGVTQEKILKEIDELIGRGETTGQQPLGFTQDQKGFRIKFQRSKKNGTQLYWYGASPVRYNEGRRKRCRKNIAGYRS